MGVRIIEQRTGPVGTREQGHRGFLFFRKKKYRRW